MKWSPDGKMLVVESSAGGYVYDTSAWSLLNEITRSNVQDGWFTQLTFSPDQQLLLFLAGYGKLFWQYDLHTQKISRAFEYINRNTNTLYQPVFSADGKLLLHKLPENGLDQWAEIAVYAFSPDGTLIAAGGDDDVVRVWEVASETLKYQFQPESDIRSLSFSPDENLLVSTGSDAAVRFWNIQDGTSLFTLHGTVDEFYHDGTLLFGATEPQTSHLPRSICGIHTLVSWSDIGLPKYTSMHSTRRSHTLWR